jgi:SAM-dependent methyltransferase
MSELDYWRRRLQRFGHTGWSDAAVYAYDQRLRLAAIAATLGELTSLRREAALDYGCGVGDFCALLARSFVRVDGHDPVPEVLEAARRRHPARNIRWFDQHELDGTPRYDLVLCVTVLQHVTDDAELDTLLSRLAGALRPGGYFVVLETFAGRADASWAATLKRRRVDDLIARCAAAGLALQTQRGFYHPTEAPTPAFVRYRVAWPVRGMARAAGWGWVPARRWLERRAESAVQFDAAYLDQPDSPTRLLVFRRVAF